MKLAFALSTIAWAATAQAMPSGKIVKTSDLKLSCSGIYQVLTSTPYFIPADFSKPTRVTPKDKAGTKESIKVLSLTGGGCAKLFNYGIILKPDQVLPFGVNTDGNEAEAISLSQHRVGKKFKFSATQSFGYVVHGDQLPLFPLVHEETVSVLSLSGAANVKKLYGIPKINELTEPAKLKVVDETMLVLDYGINLNHFSYAYNEWIYLLKALDFHDLNSGQSFADSLTLLFRNLNKKTSSFTTGEVGALVGQKLSAVLNQFGGTKWVDKIQVLKSNPLLLDRQLLAWALHGETLLLSALDIEDFLTYALETAKALAKVKQVNEAAILLAQYKGAAESLATPGANALSGNPPYELTAQSKLLIEQILAIQ